MKTDFSQKDLADTVWLLHIWDKGTKTIMLPGVEMRQISAVTQQSQLNAQQSAITQVYPTGMLTLILDHRGLVSHTPYSGSNFPGDGLHWKDTAQTIKVTRKTGKSSKDI